MKLESIENEVEKLPMIESIEDLHTLLSTQHCDFSRNDKDYYYVVEFVDNSTDSILFCSCYDSPILAIRELPAILEKTKSNIENVLIQLRYAVPRPTDMTECVHFSNRYLSPYLYFKRPETPTETSTEVSGDVEDNK